MDGTPKPWIVELARTVVLGGCIVAAAAMGARAVIGAFRIRHQDHRITVTGSATRRIQSDFIVWRSVVRGQDPTLTGAYKKIAADVPAVLAFIKSHAIDQKNVTVSSAAIQEVHPLDREGRPQEDVTSAYVAEQTIEVSSGDIPSVEKVSRAATELLDRGIYVRSNPPLYINTKLASLKIQMLAEASKDARLRAEQMASNTGAKIGGLLTARMGVLQINPAYSTEVSAEGNNDKTTLEKDVLAVVTASFDVK
jgi:uncharacterized protein